MASCIDLLCQAGGTEKAPTFDDMATTCKDGYLWPYNDASATVTRNAAPDYQVCPKSATTAQKGK